MCCKLELTSLIGGEIPPKPMRFVHLGSQMIVGASLSEPHNSRTALGKCVCMLVCLQPYTVNFKSALNIFRKFDVLVHFVR